MRDISQGAVSVPSHPGLEVEKSKTHLVAARSKNQSVVRVRNKHGGKNSQTLCLKDVKGAARSNFKKNMPSSAKPNGKLDKVIVSKV